MKRSYFKVALVLIGALSVPTVYAQTAGEYLQNGNDAFKARDFKEAVLNYTKAIEINPDYAKAYDNRGVAYAQQGFLRPAIADFTMAIANNPNDATGYNNRGHAYAHLGKLSQAIADYTKAVRINAIYVKAYNNRAFVFYKLKEYDKAWADVHKVQNIGGSIDHDFVEALKKASGKDQQ